MKKYWGGCGGQNFSGCMKRLFSQTDLYLHKPLVERIVKLWPNYMSLGMSDGRGFG